MLLLAVKLELEWGQMQLLLNVSFSKYGNLLGEGVGEEWRIENWKLLFIHHVEVQMMQLFYTYQQKSTLLC